jgi:riboflavin kinase
MVIQPWAVATAGRRWQSCSSTATRARSYARVTHSLAFLTHCNLESRQHSKSFDTIANARRRIRGSRRALGASYSVARPSENDRDSVSSGPDPTQSWRIAKDQTELSRLLRAKEDTSSSSISGPTVSFSSEDDFLKHQNQVFDALADQFATGSNAATKLECVPTGTGHPTVHETTNATTLLAELVPVYRYLARAILHSALSATSNTTNTVPQSLRLLDLACGTGILWPFLLARANELHVALHIVGVDLSSRIVQAAKVTADALLTVDTANQSATHHSIQVVEADMTHYRPMGAAPENGSCNSCFDVVIANACWGNLWNSTAVLEQCAHYWLNTTTSHQGGILCIAHPLGAEFVNHLHRLDPSTVPHTLPPSRREWYSILLETALPYQLIDFVHPTATIASNDSVDAGTMVPFYLAVLRRVRARALPQVVCLRATVSTGFGRGGKKLGFPTANLASVPFIQEALQSMAPGVYFGWAVIEGSEIAPSLSPDSSLGDAENGRNVPQKAVVNIGYSPTFVGQENPVKIVEAHLIMDDADDADTSANTVFRPKLDPPDFYGEMMRLQLVGFLRPEMKFPSFPDLIAQIRQDVLEASIALEQEPYSLFQFDDFAQQSNMDPWIGSSGGDKDASWEARSILLPREKVISHAE